MSLHRHKWEDKYKHCVYFGCTSTTVRKVWRDYKVLWFLAPLFVLIYATYYILYPFLPQSPTVDKEKE